MSGGSWSTVAALVERQAAHTPDAVALLSSDGGTVTYRALADKCASIVAGLAAHGVGAGRAVAVLLPNGVETAITFLGVAGATVCAPLNPTLTEAELRFFLADLAAAAVVVDDEADGPVATAARELSIPVLSVSTLLECGSPVGPSTAASRGPDDVALVLHTSGTTSRPKQVALTHANLIASAGNVAATLLLGPEDRCLNVMPLFHIHGLVAALLASLSSGGSVVCTPGMDPARFFSSARDAGATWYTAVPTIHHAVLTAARADSTIPDGLQFRFVRSSSAALSPSMLGDLEATFGVPVVEAYGMTEAAHQMASNPLPPAIRKPGTVGVAAGPEVTILDESGRELPRGFVGEIAVRGPNVMSGYVANPEANANAFEGGWFRTGDQGLIDADGYVTITGRLKELINRGGEKISPREVDEVLLEHPAVEQVVTFAVEHPTLGEDVAAAVVLCDHQVSDAELRAFARERLSAHKVPRRFVRLDQIPKGPTGKIQRIGFADRISVVHEDVTTSGTPFEAAVGGLWREVLGVEQIGPDDDFFALGGDSLRAMELVAAASDVFGVELAVRDVFEEAVTVRGMAMCIETARREGRQSAPPSDQPPCVTSQPTVSLAQEREWFLAALTPDQPVGNVTLAMRLHGPLHYDRLERALDELVARHDMLRARFTLAAGRPEIEVTPLGRAPLHVHAPADLSTVEAEASARAAEPIDLTVAPLLRVHLYPVANNSRTAGGDMNASELASRHDDHVLLVVAHHIVADGWTRGILRNELAALYAGESLPPSSVGYLALAASERAAIAAGKFDGDLRWWAGHFDPLPESLLLPSDRRRPPRLDLRTQTVRMQLDQDLSAEVRAFAAREGLTLFMTLLAGFEALVARHTGRSDFAIGVLTNGRPRAQSHEVVGLFAGTVPLRAVVDADVTFRELLARVRAECLDVFDRQVPMQLIVDAVHPPRRADQLPLVQLLFQLRNLPPVTSTMGDVRLETLDIPTGANAAELECDVIDDGAALSVRCEFSSAAFDAATIEQLLGRFELLLRHAVAAPDTPMGRLDLLTPDERALLDGFGRGPALTPTTRRADEMLAACASEAPDAIALVAGDERLTYRELDRWVNRIARHLHAEGVAPGAVVGLCLRREAVMVAALHAVWRAGFTVVPLDPSWPAARMQMVVEDAGLDAAIVQTASAERLPVQLRTIIIDHSSVSAAISRQRDGAFEQPRHNELAYIEFTSGSTGRPKGVEVEHTSLSAYCVAQPRSTGLGSADVILASHPITFDAYIDELVVALTVGARVVLVDDHDRADAKALITLIDREGVTVVTSTPTLLSALVSAGWAPGEGVEAWAGGEVLPAALAAELVQRCGRVLNLYGPTETTVYVSQQEVDASDLDGSQSIPIGRPAGDHRFVVVDDRGEPVPVGVYGELLIAGQCVARGYRNRPELTAAAFVNRPDPFTDELRRWYCTGDVVRWRADGALEYAGRRDSQVKLRAVRIEFGDVEAAIAAHPSVLAAAAAVRGEQLVAWVVLSGDTPAADLRRHCADLLPLSMVPAAFVALDELPHNASGKLDREALPDPETSTRPSGREPSTPTEIALAELWRELFGADAGKVDEEFFDLGGHSLLVISLFAAIEERFGKELPLSQIFETPTIASLAAVLDDVGPVAGSVVTLQEGDSEQPGLFLLPGLDGSPVIFHRLIRVLDVPGVVYGVQIPGQRGQPRVLTMEEIAALLVPDVLEVAGGRQIVLAGFSFGGKLVFEMARQLAAQDAHCRLVIVDSGAPEPSLSRRVRERLRERARRASRAPVRWWRARRRPGDQVAEGSDAMLLADRAARKWAKRNYRPPKDYRHDVVLLASAATIASSGDSTLWWRRYVSGSIELRSISGDHQELLRPRTEAEVAAILADVMEMANGPG